MSQFQSFDTPPVIAGDLPPREPAWPMVFGVISVVLAGLGIATNACGALGSLVGGPFMTMFMKSFLPRPTGTGANAAVEFERMMDAMRPWMIISGIVSLISLGVSVWLLMAGISLLKRRAVGVRQHIGWAWVRIAMVLVTAGVTLGSHFANSAAMAKMHAANGAAQPAWVTVLMGVFTVVVLLFFGLAYPIVVLVYMRKPKVLQHVASWKA